MKSTKKVEIDSRTKDGQFLCQNCGHTWFPRKAGIPARCPHCNSDRWNDARGRLRPPRAEQLETAAKRKVEQAEETLKIPLSDELRRIALENLNMFSPRDAAVHMGTTNAGQWHDTGHDSPFDRPRISVLDMMNFQNDTDEFWKVNEVLEDGICLTGDDIFPGDVIHFRKGLQPSNGDIVLALGTDLDGRHFVTTKHYHETGVTQNGQRIIELRPSNPKCSVIRAFPFNVEIEGVAINVIRMELRKRSKKVKK